MGLDMYAFSLERSPAFTKVGDVLNYRIPADGKELPEGAIFLGTNPQMLAELAEVVGPNILGMPATFSPIMDVGSEFLDSKYVLPGSKLLYRWRKHHDLHSWMERRWRGMPWHRGAGGDFNNKTRVVLGAHDLDVLEHLVSNSQLPRMPGYSIDTRMEDDLAFTNAARAELAAGKFVYYTSWW